MNFPKPLCFIVLSSNDGIFFPKLLFKVVWKVSILIIPIIPFSLHRLCFFAVFNLKNLQVMWFSSVVLHGLVKNGFI